MDAVKRVALSFLEVTLPLLLPLQFIISFLGILPGAKAWWFTQPARIFSINVAADELIKSMGWSDLRPRVIRVPIDKYDAFYPFIFADFGRAFMAFMWAVCNRLTA
jgi:hypothetical protein